MRPKGFYFWARPPLLNWHQRISRYFWNWDIICSVYPDRRCELNNALLNIFQSPVVIGLQVISPGLRNPSHPHCGSHTLCLTHCALSYIPTAVSSVAKAAPIHNLPPLRPIATAEYITISEKKKICLLTQISIFSSKDAHHRTVCLCCLIPVCLVCSRQGKLLKIPPSTPINIQELATELSAHPRSVFRDHLLTGNSQGFWVGVISTLGSTYVAKNLQTAVKHPMTGSHLLWKELNKG